MIIPNSCSDLRQHPDSPICECSQRCGERGRQSPSPRLRSDPWSRQVEDRASEAEARLRGTPGAASTSMCRGSAAWRTLVLTLRRTRLSAWHGSGVRPSFNIRTPQISGPEEQQGFERGHGPFPPARRRKPASQWGPETQSLPELQVLAVGTRIRGQLSY